MPPLLKEKVSLFELQKLLTHSTPQMTQRYARLHDETLRKASDLAGALFGQIQEKCAPLAEALRLWYD